MEAWLKNALHQLQQLQAMVFRVDREGHAALKGRSGLQDDWGDNFPGLHTQHVSPTVVVKVRHFSGLILPGIPDNCREHADDIICYSER